MGGLAETDSSGVVAAYSCSADQGLLEPVSDSPSALRCPTCGRRTDEIGRGFLDDGFDVIHHQWGLGGDQNAWHAMRELVGETPTPPDREAVREAYVDALRHVAEVDIDHTDQRIVYRQQLDHGGMSGGGVDVEWWRTKGIPLLVERATDRRPQAHSARPQGSRTVRKLLTDIAIWTVVLAIPLALIGGGTFLLYQRAVGTRVEATVLECDSSGTVVRGAAMYRTDCIAQWWIDERLVIGPFSGGNGHSDVGKTVDATVRGNTAYSRSLALPILLLALGVPILAVPVIGICSKFRSRPVDPAP